jgi:hypothetical protein
MTTTNEYLDQRVGFFREMCLDITTLKQKPQKEVYDNMVHYYSGMKLCINLLKSLDLAEEFDSNNPYHVSMQKLADDFDEVLEERGMTMSKEQKITRYCETFDALYSRMLNILDILTKS